MRGRLTFIFVIAFLSALDGICFATGTPEIMFNAQTNQFMWGPDEFTGPEMYNIPAWDKVWVVVENVNTFSYSYVINGQVFDYHNATMPTALAQIVSNTAPANTATSGPGANFPYSEIFNEGENEAKAPTLNALLTDYINFYKAGEALESTANAVYAQILARMIGQSTIADLKADQSGDTKDKIDEQTNAQIRRNIAYYLHTQGKNFSDNLKTAMENYIESTKVEKYINDAEAQYRQKLEKVRPEIESYLSDAKTTSTHEQDYIDWFNKNREAINTLGELLGEYYNSVVYKQYDAALQKWNEDYAIYTILGPAKAAGNGASKDLSALATVVANFDAKIQQSLAQYDGTSIKAIYLAVLDPGIVPVIITNDLGFVNGDKVLASITVTRAAPPSLSIASTALAGTSAAAAPATGSASTLLTANLASQTYTMMARTFWRPVLDYSLGLGWASYGQTNYYLDSTRIVRSGASDSADIGAAALAQLYFTPFMLGDLVGLTAGPCIGVMQANQPNLLLGVSGIISVGSRVRVSASIGDAWGKVTVLNGDKVGSVAQSTTETSPSTASVIQQGTFWSITASYSF